MQPTLKNGDLVFASSLPYLFKNPKTNDIVTFKEKTGKVLIKRITKIENGRYYVVGDNKYDSLDSRVLGNIKKSEILGKVIYKF